MPVPLHQQSGCANMVSTWCDVIVTGDAFFMVKEGVLLALQGHMDPWHAPPSTWSARGGCSGRWPAQVACPASPIMALVPSSPQPALRAASKTQGTPKQRPSRQADERSINGERVKCCPYSPIWHGPMRAGFVRGQCSGGYGRLCQSPIATHL